MEDKSFRNHSNMHISAQWQMYLLQYRFQTPTDTSDNMKSTEAMWQ
jgi:hypothetical protein